MLDFMRRKAQSPSIQATILIIVLVFVFWGVGTNQGGGPNSIATVNDANISYQQYQRAYEQTLARYRQQFGDNLPPGLLEALNLKEQVLNQLIQQLAMQQGATEAGLIASKEEVRKIIQDMESFRENGIFSLDRYKKLLASSKMTTAEFEDSIRTDLLNSKIATQISRFARVSENETRERFALENDAVKLEYAVFNAENFKNKVTIEEPELAAFFENKKTAYQTEPQIKLKYLSFQYDQALADSAVSDQDIEQYYAMHKDKFSFPEKRRARHILIKTDDKDSQELRNIKRDKLAAILTLAKAGKDFAALAKEHSEDISETQGGDLGFFSKTDMVQPFSEAAFSLKKGEISDIVETSFGYHIIKLEDIQPSRETPLGEAREQIVRELKKQKGKEVTFQMANQAYEGIITAGSLTKYAEANAAPVLETDFFSRSTPPKELAGDAPLLSAAFALKKGELSSLIETGEGFAILFAEDGHEPQIPPLAEVRARVEVDFTADKARTLAREAAVTLLGAARTSSSLKDEAAKADVPVRETGFFSKSKLVTSGLPGTVAAMGLQLSEAAPFPETTADENDAFYVLKFVENKKAGEDEFTRQKAALFEMLQQEKQMRIMADWLSYLQASAEVTTNKKFLQ